MDTRRVSSRKVKSAGKKKESRRHLRVRIPENRLLQCEGVGRSLHGRVSVLGQGGMFIRTRDRLRIGTSLGVRLHSDGEVVEARCVVRDVEPGGLGVEFGRLGGRQAAGLKKLLSRLKR